MADIDVNEFVTRMANSFQPEKAAGIDATVQFNLSGEQPMQGYMIIKDKKCTVQKGVAENPRLTVSAKSEDLQAIFSGKLDAMQAFMQGKIKIAGDMSLAMKLITLFKM